MRFLSIQSRFILLMLLFLLPTLSAIYWFVSRENLRYTDQTINSYLDIGVQVFDFNLAEHSKTLLTISGALTRDWGFRNAFGAADQQTILDAARNLLDRSNGAAGLMLIADMQGRVIVDTSEQGFDALPGPWRTVVNDAVNHPEGIADDVLLIGGVPHLVSVSPLYLPTPVAWIFAGFPLDDQFTSLIRQSTASEISIVRSTSQISGSVVVDVVASSLASDLSRQLSGQIELHDSTATQRIRLHDQTYGTRFRQINSAVAGGDQVYAVIQRSYRENEENLAVLRQRILDFSIAIVCLCLIAVILLARSFSKPIMRIADRVVRIQKGDYGAGQSLPVVTSRDELGKLAESVENMAMGLAEREKVRDLLGKVVSHRVADELLRKKPELGGEEKEVSILFADITGFTRLSEKLQPEQVLTILNTCLEQICRIIEKNNGIVDKFTGDGVMAVFGAPVTHNDDCLNAVKTAAEIRACLPAINRLLDQQGVSLDVRVGVHSGNVVAGNTGSSSRLNYTVIGDAVNLAARIESMTRIYQVGALVSGESRQALESADNTFVWREVDWVQVRGRESVVTLYELVGMGEQLSADVSSRIERFHEGLQCYRSGQWGAALDVFQRLNDEESEAIVEVFIARITHLNSIAPADWNGVYRHQDALLMSTQ